MAAPVSVPTSESPTAGAPQPALIYAPARPAGLSLLIDHLGPGYAVVRLPQPPRWLESLRLSGLMLIAGCFLVALGLGPRILEAMKQGSGRDVNEVGLLVVIGVLLSGFTVFAVATIGQIRRLIRRPRRPRRGDGSITLRRPEALPDATDAFTVLRVSVESPLLKIAGSYLRVETPTGRVLELLRGHSETMLHKLCGDLQTHLLVSRIGVPDAKEVR